MLVNTNCESANHINTFSFLTNFCHFAYWTKDDVSDAPGLHVSIALLTCTADTSVALVSFSENASAFKATLISEQLSQAQAAGDTSVVTPGTVNKYILSPKHSVEPGRNLPLESSTIVKVYK